ncbi:MAG TPA: hypothetical protein VJ022_13020 [Anaerolineales bacterium]|nr:hypothetical protein [Anaerolineales bacterium]
MPIRPLALLDLPQLYRFREEAIGLDTARTLTRGNPLGAVRLLAYMNPARHVYGAIANGEHDSVLGGIIHTGDDAFAKLLYLAPLSNLGHPELPALIEALSSQAGTWGAFHVLAEVDEMSDAFVPLRKAGFSVYAWQRMWQTSELTHVNERSDWTRVRSVHLPAVQSLYHQIVPPLLQPVEQQPKTPIGWMSNEGPKCHVSALYGVRGIVLTPLIHPEATEVSSKLAALISNLPDRRNRPIYVCVRSYQAWLEPVLADLGAKAGDRQAVMVKHLARLLKEGQTAPAVPSGVSVQPSQVSRVEGKK